MATYSDDGSSTLQPPPSRDDSTLGSTNPFESPSSQDGMSSQFVIGEPEDDEEAAAVDLRASGMSLPNPEELKIDRGVNDGCFKMWVGLIVGLIFVCSLTVGLTIGQTKKKIIKPKPSVPVVSRETVRIDMKSFLVVNDITQAAAFNNASSPQSLALDFLANEDQLRLNAPLSNDLSSPDAYRFLSRYIMTVFYESLGGDKWFSNVNFKSKEETCEWHSLFPEPIGKMGVECVDGKIVKLVFGLNQMRGTLPPELGALSTLKDLRTWLNGIEGGLPETMKRLTNLETVIFLDEALEGEFPKWINSWEKLRLLYLSDNEFGGSLPDTLGELQALTALAVDDNQITGSLDAVWKLKNLEYLFLQNNVIEGELPPSITATNPLLKGLDLSSNDLKGRLPSDLFKLFHLEVLDLHGNDFWGNLPSDIKDDNNLLTHIALHENRIGGSIPTRMGLLDQLVHLDLSSNHLNGTIPTQLGNLVKLNYLHMGKNRFATGPIPSFIYGLRELVELAMPYSNRNGQLLPDIEFIGKLKLLDLNSNTITGPMPSEIGTITPLQYLLLNNNNFTGSVPSQFSTLRNLHFMLLDHNDGLQGNLQAMCDLEVLSNAWVDCPITCSCCECCAPGVNARCHSFEKADSLDPEWKLEFQRSTYYYKTFGGT